MIGDRRRLSSLVTGVLVPGLAHLVSAQSTPPTPPIVLTDVTDAVGLDWVQIERNTMLGAGAAFLDFDGDGWLDILLSGGQATPGLYRNTAGGTQFVAVTPPPFQRATFSEYLCVTVGDIDNDGDPDVFFGTLGYNMLYRNDGGGKFVDITSAAIAGGLYGFTTSAAFGDYDSDGILDLYIGNYIAPGSMLPIHTPTPNVLLHGNGDGTFAPVTTAVVAGAGTALATAWTDFDNDGDSDIMLGNDFGATVEPNQLYRNDGPGDSQWRFTETAAAMQANVGIYCMGIAAGDCDRDGDLDYYVTNLGRNVFLRNDGDSFTDIATQTGTELTYDPNTSPPLLATSWGTGFHDFDNDGWLDLYVSNGFIRSDPALANGANTRNTVYHHDGPSMTYSEAAWLDDGVGRGVAFGDYDNDGDVDVLQANVAAQAVLMRNDSPQQGHWFAAKLRGRNSNRDAIGARVDLYVNSFTPCREVRRNDSFESSSEPKLNFGLGDDDWVQRAEVRWPSGIRQQLHDLPAGQQLAVVEPIVTLERGSLTVIELAAGRLLLLGADLVAHGAPIGPTYAGWQIRSGGVTRWRGAMQPVALAAGAQRPVVQALVLPSDVGGQPGPVNLEFVWLVSDSQLAIDEEKIAIP